MRVAVIGAGVSGLAAAHELSVLGHDVTVLEGTSRIGGLVHTERTPEGLLLEHGPDSLLSTKPGLKEEIASLGLEDELIRGGGRSYVLSRESLRPLPGGLLAMSPGAGWQMMRSTLFSWRGKGRFLLEPFVPARRETHDESISDFFARRFGREIVDRLVDPLIGGIYGGATDELSMRAVMPRLSELEREHGSVSRSVLSSLRRPAVKKARHSPMMSLRDGMGSLTGALARELEGRIRLRVLVRRIERGARWRIVTARHGDLEVDGVVVATPAWYTAQFLEGVDSEMARELGDIRSSRIDAVTFAWRRDSIGHALDGTGFVVDRSEARPMRACTWVSEKWPGRAPEGLFVAKVFFRDEGEASGRELVALAQDELRDVLDLRAEPIVVRLHRKRRALPRYDVGHAGRIRYVLDRAADLEGLALAGNAYRGIGIPDCMASGREAARAVTMARSRDARTSIV